MNGVERLRWIASGPWLWIATILAGIVLFGFALGFPLHQTHLAMIEARGAQVMPFDQQRTVHVFQKSASGGIESVVVRDAADQQQIDLIRAHLATEAAKFRQGDYEDPAAIHGPDMPGLGELAAGHDRVNVTYEDLPTGGRISYGSDEADLIAALHAWFDRQLHDHGPHAAAG